MKQKKPNNNEVPITHPRYLSLNYRHKIIEGMKHLIVAEAGLIAHGRGECFDYILGEKTNDFALNAMRTAVAMLLLAKNPVISVNGNTAALVPNQLVKLSKILKAPLEINLFYKKRGRVKAIKNVLKSAGATNIRGINRKEIVQIEGLDSNRRFVESIAEADLVMVPLEDGDRTEALKKIGKKVIAIDLNPLSRTSLNADVTIIDNVTRTLPEMIKIAIEFKNFSESELSRIIDEFDNERNIKDAIDQIVTYLISEKENAFKRA
ncbi:MAG: phosphopantothenate/pantothenate synthetase [Promethearchaeota archaeon]|nr:MAG: phosphopantothenate/pantothenate synthetase [Candidatus Lokiarchaeota archaeon]